MIFCQREEKRSFLLPRRIKDTPEAIRINVGISFPALGRLPLPLVVGVGVAVVPPVPPPLTLTVYVPPVLSERMLVAVVAPG